MPTATASGTEPIGSRKNIGTRISCVGTAEPLEISKSSRNASAYAPISSATVRNDGLRADGINTKSPPATTRKAPTETKSVARSRLAKLSSRRARRSSITR